MSRSMEQVYRFIERAALYESTVLIQGESGTGKELVARAIHEMSNRSRNTFAAINCAALTESLLESELFGHERGAFTGAFERAKGLIEHADGGSFFLDELGELAPAMQAKLLRVLEERRVTRVGGRTATAVDIRFIAATNKNLLEEVGRGTFRNDLYYRVGVVLVTLPPLRERREDIPVLANHFRLEFGKRLGRDVNGFLPRTIQIFLDYPWPGNVRELRNAIEYAILLGNGPLISPEDLPKSLQSLKQPTEVTGYRQSLATSRKQLLQEAIQQAGGNLTEAARILGVHRNYVYRLVKKMDLRPAPSGRAHAAAS